MRRRTQQVEPKLNFQTIAAATRIPKSYVSKVINEKAHFSADQLYLVCDILAFSEQQHRFVGLLLEAERCQVEKRRDDLVREIQRLRDAALDTREHVKANPRAMGEDALREYYLNPLHPLVHVFLSIPRYQSDLSLLAAALQISLSELRIMLETLEGLGVIERQKHKVKSVVKELHLPKTSPVYKPWRVQTRVLCLERLNRGGQKDDYSYSATFSTTEKVRQKLQAEFFEYLKQAQGLVAQSNQEDVLQINFDLFRWGAAAGKSLS